ncbi:MAG: N-acetylmuramoyl-L-alanine amidase [Persicimonas sp.]
MRTFDLRCSVSWLLVVALSIVAGGCGMYDDPQQPHEEYDEEYETRRGSLEAMCQVEVEGHGTLDLEEEYLAQVVQCENPHAPFEALKAQAIAARGYAKYFGEVEGGGRALAADTDDQMYACGDPPSEDVKRAVRETAGVVPTHNDKVIAPFYVAGAVDSDPNTCQGGVDDPTNTEHYVTYNQHKVGSQVTPSSLGWEESPANRGALSQNGSSCLAEKGWDHERILRYYYGDDVRATKLSGSCVDSSDDDPASQGGVVDDSAGGGNDECGQAAADPNIITRSEWGARPPKNNRAKHDPKRFTIHHTTGPNDTAKSVQNYHMDKRGWLDVGYHYMIDKQGKIYQGNPVDRQGAHAYGHNVGNIGIALLGDYENNEPHQAQIDAVGKLMRQLADKYGIEVDQDTVSGHRDLGSTVCPGQALYDRLDQIIEKANGSSQECTSDDDNQVENPDEQEFKYVRVEAVSDEPRGHQDTLDGFELDSVYFQRGQGSGEKHTASSVVSSSQTDQPENALGDADNQSCDDRSSTLAVIETGGDLVVEFDQTFETNDVVSLYQGNPDNTDEGCEPSGSVDISVSADGETWYTIGRDKSVGPSAVVDPTGVRFAQPKADSTQESDVHFEVEATEDVTKVEYLADDWSMGESTEGPNFPFDYEFDNGGTRQLEARAYNSSDEVIATDQIAIDVDKNGGVDTQLADELGSEGGICSNEGNGEGGPRCSDGRGGYSTGQCWAFVKAAMIRSGLGDRNDINQLAQQAGMSAYDVQVSAAGFKRAADKAPGALASTMGLEKIDANPTDAPRGAVIAYSPNCMDAHARYGHIEISQGDGYACSDYCDEIRGNAECASVYAPTAN